MRFYLVAVVLDRVLPIETPDMDGQESVGGGVTRAIRGCYACPSEWGHVGPMAVKRASDTLSGRRYD